MHVCVQIKLPSSSLTIISAISMKDSQNEMANNTGATALLTAVAYLHIILIIVPTFVLGIIIIVVIWKEKKSSRLTPIMIFYLAMALFCVAAVLTYGLLWDISSIMDIPYLGECGTFPLYNIYNLLYFGFHSIIALNVGAAAFFQFLVLKHGTKISSKWVYIALLSLIITSIGISCIFFNGRNSTTIKGSNCRYSDDLKGTINVASWISLAYTAPLALTIVFSVLTCNKVKKAIVQPLNDERPLVTSIVQINVFNILLYSTFRLASILLYFLGSRLLSRDEDTAVIIIISRHLNDASYPATLISILVVHKGLRRIAARLFCARPLGERSTDIRMTMTVSSEAAKSTN